MKSSVLRFVFAALFAIGLSLYAVAQQGAASAPLTKPGAIKVGKIDGIVYRLMADGQSLQLKVGDVVIETDTIQTEKGALVVLVFANGASVKLGGDSKLKIEEFKMDPLDEDLVVANLEREPSVSKTALNLAYGEMVGDVKHLNHDKGSQFNIRTPVGAAGIRGTQFRIVFRPTGDGKSFTFQLSTADGRVAYEGTVQAPAGIEVPKGEEIVVTAEATVDTSTGAVQVTSVEVPATTQAISTEASAQITQAVTTVITEAVQSTTITTTEQQQAATTDTSSGSTQPTAPATEEKKEEETKEEEKKEETKTEETKTEETKSETTPTETPTSDTTPKTDTTDTSKSGQTTPPPAETPTPTTNTNTPTNTPGATTTPSSLTPGAGG